MNYFEQFYNFLTYNPDNIPLTHYIPHLTVYCLVWAILLFLTSWMFSNRFSFWLIARSAIWAPYMVFYNFWILCFLGEGFLPNSIPMLPILLCLGVSIVWKKYKKHNHITKPNTITT